MEQKASKTPVETVYNRITPPSSTAMEIKRAEVKTLYEKQGYVTSIPVLSPEELQQAKDAFAELERKFGEFIIVHQWINNNDDNNNYFLYF